MKYISGLLLMFFSPIPLVAGDTPPPSLQLLQPQQQPAVPGQQPGPAAASLHDIYGPITLAEPFPYLLYGIILLLVLVAGAIIYWLWRTKKPQAFTQVPPDVVARDALLRARELMDENGAVPYMDRVSQILRSYLETQFQLPITRRTTREFFTEMKNMVSQHPPLLEFQHSLKECLAQCDMAKYAHQSCDRHQLMQLEDSILTFINNSSIPNDNKHTGEER